MNWYPELPLNRPWTKAKREIDNVRGKEWSLTIWPVCGLRWRNGEPRMLFQIWPEMQIRIASWRIPSETERTARMTYDDENSPHVLVVEKLQTVAFDIQQTSDHRHQQDDQQEARIVRWTKDVNLTTNRTLFLRRDRRDSLGDRYDHWSIWPLAQLRSPIWSSEQHHGRVLDEGASTYRLMSMKSLFFGFIFAGKWINTGAEFSFN